MSGNAEEWTLERAPGVNPMRGGSANDTAGGIACTYNFTVASDTIQLPTVGFRCCADTAPWCTNGQLDQDEEGVDCGGSCLACACTMNSQCASNLCLAGRCRPTCNEFGTNAFGYRGCQHVTTVSPCDDISATGTAVALTDDSNSGSLAIGFTFDFFGTSYTNVRIQSNGALTFDTSGTSTIQAGNSCLPKGTAPDELIAALWDDLDPTLGGGQVFRQLLGTAPNRRFVVLYEGSNHISVCYPDPVYGNATYDYGLTATTGIQHSTMGPLQFSCNTASIAQGLVLDYLHP
jgi:hypothetical protein